MIKRIALTVMLFSMTALTGCGDSSSEPSPTETVTAMEVPQDEPTATESEATAPRELVAHVSAIFEGTEAFVGETRATVGQPIYTEDHFFTGPGTKMEVTMEDGGIVLLDANTDPIFQKAQCFWLRLTSGAMTVRNKRKMCVEAGGPKFSQHSYVYYAAREGKVTVAVFEGQVTTIEPAGYTVNEGQIFYLQNGDPTGQPQPMDQNTINTLQSWIPRVIL